MVARQWATVPEIEKTVWKERAIETHEAAPIVEGGAEHEELMLGDVDDDVDDDDDDDEEDDDEEDDHPEGVAEKEEQPVKRGRGRPRKKL
jgi:hypothetical protein